MAFEISFICLLASCAVSAWLCAPFATSSTAPFNCSIPLAVVVTVSDCSLAPLATCWIVSAICWLAFPVSSAAFATWPLLSATCWLLFAAASMACSSASVAVFKASLSFS